MIKELEKLQNENNYRSLKSLDYEGNFIIYKGKKLLNLCSNDYLSLNINQELKHKFLKNIKDKDFYFSSASSRSLSGGFSIFEELESLLENFFKGKNALLFNSGFSLNYSCIQALATLKNTLFLADKFIHASMIDGLKGANFFRFRHNDMQNLSLLLEKHHKNYERIIILSEALFSMDGDFAHIKQLVEFKETYKNILLYIDEAHSVGCFDESGLGIVKSLGLEEDIDFLVLTFGKALASCGACMLCSRKAKDFFINKARALIYSTALAPINVAFTKFIFERLKTFDKERKALKNISSFFKNLLKDYKIIGDAYIVSLLIGSNEKASFLANKLLENGFFAPAIKEPTVPKNTARIRFSLNANLKEDELLPLKELL